jgi:hypothetical protein
VPDGVTKKPMSLRRIVLHTFRNGAYVECFTIRLYGPTPIDTSGYVSATHEQMEAACA